MMRAAIGTLATPAKNPPMPTSTKALGSVTMWGKNLWQTLPIRPAEHGTYEEGRGEDAA